MQKTSPKLGRRTVTAAGMIAILLAATDLGWSRSVTTTTAKAPPKVTTTAVGKVKKAPVVVTGVPVKTATTTGTTNSTAIEFSGQATMIDFTNIHMGPPFVIIGDTEQLPSTGGDIEVSVTETNMEGLSLALGSATTQGMDDTAMSTVSLNTLSITIETTNMVRHTITADVILQDVSATCSGPDVGGTSSVTLSAHSSIQGLAVDGVAIPVTGDPNQVVDLGDFTLVVNEQFLTNSDNYGAIVLSALHIIDPGCLEGLVGVLRADIRCANVQPPPPPQPPPGTNDCGDFITGGGWIVGPNGCRANFAVAGGIRNGAFWGHLNYIDHATGMHVKSTAVTAYSVVADLTRDISFNVNIDGIAGTAVVRVTDNGEPGRDDTFGLALSSGYTAGGSLGGDHPGGGNIQLHKIKCRSHDGGGDHGKPCDKDGDHHDDHDGKPCDKDKDHHDEDGKPCDKDGKSCDKDKGKDEHGKDGQSCDKDKEKSDKKDQDCDKDKATGKAKGKGKSPSGGTDKDKDKNCTTDNSSAKGKSSAPAKGKGKGK